MFKDRLLLGGTAGALGILPDLAIEYGAYFLGFSHTTTGMQLAEIIFLAKSPSVGEIAIGTLAHFITGAVLGAALLMMLAWSGDRAFLLKGAGLGAALWLNHTILVPCLAAARVQLERTVPESLVDLAALLAWSMSAAWLIVRFTGEQTSRT